MFKQRPKSVLGTIWVGVAIVTLGLIFTPFVFNDPLETTQRGFPYWLVAGGCILFGAYILAQGLVWRSRDKS